MTGPANRSSNPEIRAATRGLAEARDEQILRVVAMVDAMPDRGAADQLIAPSRPRLARLRPPRPLRFARLLFLPLDPLIVPAARWRPEQPGIPRTAIPILAASVEMALGPEGQTIASMIEGRSTRDFRVIEEAGALLWRLAVPILLTAAAPLGWETTGLAERVHGPLARRIGALLLRTERLRRMMADAALGLVPPETAHVQAFLSDADSYDPGAWSSAIALLLSRVPEAAQTFSRIVRTLGQRDGKMFRDAWEQAAAFLLDGLEAPGGVEGQLGGHDLSETGATVRRLMSLLAALEDDPLLPSRRDRLDDLRERIRIVCQALFAERLSSDLVEPLRAYREANAAWELETAARGLRTLETEARRAGGDTLYDTLLGQAADLIREMIVLGTLDRGGGLRLLEITAGPEAALALLGEAV